jgi:Protein of unknown function (DUF5818)
MRNLLCLSVLLLCAAWVTAQTYPSQPSSSSSSPSGSAQTTPSTSSSSQASTGMSDNQTKVEGCLNSSGGSYTLTASDGTTYQLSGDTSQLAEHVGHEVQVTGTKSAASASSPSSSSSAGTSAASSGQAGTSGMGSSSQQSLSVVSIKHIAKTCSGSSR